jgi:hypothetical protein
LTAAVKTLSLAVSDRRKKDLMVEALAVVANTVFALAGIGRHTERPTIFFARVGFSYTELRCI